MEPTSSRQYRASTNGTLPSPELVAEDVWAVASPIPEGQIPYTLTYVLRGNDHELTLIDPGWNTDHNFHVLQASLAQLGFNLDQVASTISTHYHPDHLGIADRIRQHTGAHLSISTVEQEVIAYEATATEEMRANYAKTLERWAVPKNRRPELIASFDRPSLTGVVTADQLVSDGQKIQIGAHRLVAITTPGHTSGHMCLVDADRKIIFTGDHVLPAIFSGVGLGSLPGTAPLADYLTSLERLERFDGLQALPGHEYRFTGLHQRRTAIAMHHLKRTKEVQQLEPALGDSPTWNYAEKMSWTVGWGNLHNFMLHSALQQVDMHRDLIATGAAGALFESHFPNDKK